MAIPIDMESVRRALLPHIGSRALAGDMLVIGVTNLLQSYAPYRESLEELQKRLLDYLSKALERLTGGYWVVRLDDYREVRLTRDALESAADGAMGVLFDSLAPFSANFEKLNEYSLRVPGISAPRVLYQRYRRFFTDEQYAFLAATIRRVYEPAQYRDWLDA